jgi:hypothetical protein
MKSLASRFWGWLSRDPDDDAPEHDPSYYENPHGGGMG